MGFLDHCCHLDEFNKKSMGVKYAIQTKRSSQPQWISISNGIFDLLATKTTENSTRKFRHMNYSSEICHRFRATERKQKWNRRYELIGINFPSLFFLDRCWILTKFFAINCFVLEFTSRSHSSRAIPSKIYNNGSTLRFDCVDETFPNTFLSWIYSTNAQRK